MSSYQPAYQYEMFIYWCVQNNTKGWRAGVGCGQAVGAGEKNSRTGSVIPNPILLRGQYKCTIQMKQLNQNPNQEFR